MAWRAGQRHVWWARVECHDMRVLPNSLRLKDFPPRGFLLYVGTLRCDIWDRGGPTEARRPNCGSLSGLAAQSPIQLVTSIAFKEIYSALTELGALSHTPDPYSMECLSSAPNTRHAGLHMSSIAFRMDLAGAHCRTGLQPHTPSPAGRQVRIQHGCTRSNDVRKICHGNGRIVAAGVSSGSSSGRAPCPPAAAAASGSSGQTLAATEQQQQQQGWSSDAARAACFTLDPPDQRQPVAATVTGRLPAWLRGSFIRHGPAMRSRVWESVRCTAHWQARCCTSLPPHTWSATASAPAPTPLQERTLGLQWHASQTHV